MHATRQNHTCRLGDARVPQYPCQDSARTLRLAGLGRHTRHPQNQGIVGSVTKCKAVVDAGAGPGTLSRRPEARHKTHTELVSALVTNKLTLKTRGGECAKVQGGHGIGNNGQSGSRKQVPPETERTDAAPHRSRTVNSAGRGYRPLGHRPSRCNDSTGRPLASYGRVQEIGQLQHHPDKTAENRVRRTDPSRIRRPGRSWRGTTTAGTQIPRIESACNNPACSRAPRGPRNGPARQRTTCPQQSFSTRASAALPHS